MTDQFDQASLSFKFDSKLILLFVIFFPLLISLGLWQLDRADEKRQLQQNFLVAKQKPATQWDAHNLENYRLVSETGYFDQKRYWLLDNRVNNGKVGFDVIMSFVSRDKILFVNRGWVQGDISRQSLPVFDTPKGTINIIGRVYLPLDQKKLSRSDQWPKIIGSMELDAMSLDVSVANPGGVVRLQGDSQGALITGWPEVNVSVEKHQGYALQWFAMALALLVLLLNSSSNVFSLVVTALKKKVRVNRL